MPVSTGYSVVQYFEIDRTDAEIEEWAKTVGSQLQGAPTFGLIFASNECLYRIREISEILQIYARIPLLLGCSSNGVIAGDREVENEAGISISIYHLPETKAELIHIPESIFHADAELRPQLAHHLRDQADAHSWILFCASESVQDESWLADWDAVTGQATTIGGFAGVDPITLQSTMLSLIHI